MNLKINGKSEDFNDDDVSLTRLLTVKKVPDPDMVSVQLNGEILERETYAATELSEGDELEFLYFMGGG